MPIVLIQSLKPDPSSVPVERTSGSFKKHHLRTKPRRKLARNQETSGHLLWFHLGMLFVSMVCIKHGRLSPIFLLLGVAQVQDSEVCKCPWPSGPSSELWRLKYKRLSEPV